MGRAGDRVMTCEVQARFGDLNGVHLNALFDEPLAGVVDVLRFTGQFERHQTHLRRDVCAADIEHEIELAAHFMDDGTSDRLRVESEPVTFGFFCHKAAINKHGVGGAVEVELKIRLRWKEKHRASRVYLSFEFAETRAAQPSRFWKSFPIIPNEGA